MRLETIKWIYQRISSPIILFLSFWLIYKISPTKEFNYLNVSNFFQDYSNLILFFILFIFSILHTCIEVYHSLHDYFRGNKNEKVIRYLVNILYIFVFISILFFLFKTIIL